MDPSERAELLLLPLDPQRGFRRLIGDLTRFSALDPKLRAAVGLLDERFRGFSADDREMLSTVLWAYLRPRLAASDNLASMRAWIRDGDAVLQAVEEAMETTFAPVVLQQLIEQGKGFATPDAAAGSEFQRARDEVRRLEAEDIVAPALVGFLMGYGAASLYCDLHGC